MPAWIDLTGRRFGFVLVVKYLGGSSWRCLCEKCGKSYTKRGILQFAKRNGTQCVDCRIKQSRIHGHCDSGHGPSRMYKCWEGMIARCTNPNTLGYYNWGGRGISVCDRWRHSFLNFLNDMGEIPIGKTIERVNNNGAYAPGNCKWATKKEQCNNKRTNRHVIFRGKRMTYAQATVEIGCHSSKVRDAVIRALVPDRIVPFLVFGKSLDSRRELVALFG